jgi:nucleotide-binding universal stress UspA family protein
VTPRTVVVPLDGSSFAERAIPVGRKLAWQLGGDLGLLSARWDDVPQQAEEYLARVAEENGHAETMFVQDRGAAEAIVLEAQGDRDPVICMTTHGRGAFRWSVLGSVAEEVVRNARRPVLLVGRHCPADAAPFRTAVLTVDGSDADDPAVPVAIEWAQALGLGVEVVQVIHPLDVEDAVEPNKVTQSIVARLRDAGLSVRFVSLRSRLVAHAIADHAATVDHPIVVMSSHARTGVGRVALGSVAMGTVAMAAAPVLVVHSGGAANGG